MAKMHMVVEGLYERRLNLFLFQKKCKNCCSFIQNKIKAFSVAEATIALLIGSIALGMAAPMITKQIKQSNFTDTQFRLINNQNDRLRDSINNTNDIIDELLARIEELENNNESTPAGAIMYFDLSKCPDGWTELTKKYPKAANTFIRNKSGTSRALGHWQQNAAPEINGTFDGNTNDDGLKAKTGAFYTVSTQNRGGDGAAGGGTVGFKASLSSAAYGRKDEKGVVATEVRPDNVAFLACRKN